MALPVRESAQLTVESPFRCALGGGRARTEAAAKRANAEVRKMIRPWNPVLLSTIVAAPGEDDLSLSAHTHWS
jgi:hypothetical protein